MKIYYYLISLTVDINSIAIFEISMHDLVRIDVSFVVKLEKISSTLTPSSG